MYIKNPVELPCEVCHTWFDLHNAPHDWIGDRLVCGDCLSAYTDEELLEMLESENENS